jgi:hypothetical protein
MVRGLYPLCEYSINAEPTPVAEGPSWSHDRSFSSQCTKRHGLGELKDNQGRISVLSKMRGIETTRRKHTRPRREYDERDANPK